MSYKAALDADARIAARNALKIVAALRQTFDAKAVYEQYLSTQPNKSDNPAQDRARARAWAIMNVQPNMQAMNTVMQRVLAEGYVTGELFADEQLRIARELKKADDTYVDWANWKPGDRAAALLLRPPKAFQQLLASQGIALKEMSQTTVRDIGNAIADAVDLGLSAERSAKNIMRHVASPARALSIAITEQNRAISYATVNRYKEAGLEKMEWEVSSPCDKCARNANAVVPIGAPFPTGATQPPQHPHCRCVLLPVIPDFDEIAATPTGTTLTPMPADAPMVEPTEVIARRGYVRAKNDPDYFTPERAYELEDGVPWKPDGENEYLKKVFDEQGYNGKPTVVSADEFQKAIDSGATPLFRGVAGDTPEQVEEFVTQLLDGDKPYVGRGMFGDGTYFTDTESTAIKFSIEDRTGKTINFGKTIDAALSPEARIIDLEDVQRQFQNTGRMTPEQRDRYYQYPQDWYEDASMWAAANGYDAIRIKNPVVNWQSGEAIPDVYTIVLNRTALIIKEMP
jgi:SPP1 gp7 family putative phage head morphogenesis protein